MVEKFGSDQQQLANSGGSVISQDNAVLVNGDSDGETALLFGPAALREIQAGVANGSFAIPPSDSEATITADNALPYWTFTDVSSAGAITAALVADAGAASGYVLRFTVASGTTTGKSVTLSRFIPVASSASRSFSFYAEATFETGTNSTQANAKLTCEFYKTDQITATGTPFESDLYGFNSLQAATGITAPDLYAVAPDLTNTTAPADAAYLKLTITIATVATQSADRTVDLTEVRVAHGLPELILTDKGDPATYQPAYIFNESGDLSLVASTGENLVVGMNGYWLGSVSNTIESGGDLNLIATGDLIGTGENISMTANTQMNITSDSTSITAPSGVEVSADLTVGNNLLFNTQITIDPAATALTITRNDTGNRANIVVGRVFPGTQTTRYMDDNGSRISFSSGIDANGTVICSGAMISDAISTTTQTASAAIWVLSSGTTYSLRRNSSSARYKTNIVDADEAVLEAARKIKPRHYESTIEDESGATRLGFIAEEVEAAGLTHAVGYDAEGRVESLDTTALIAALFVRVNDLEERLKALEGA